MPDEPRTTFQTLQVLKVLLEEASAQHYGLEIARQADLPTGTIYPILARLERAGWVTSDWEVAEPAAVGRPVAASTGSRPTAPSRPASGCGRRSRR